MPLHLDDLDVVVVSHNSDDPGDDLFARWKQRGQTHLELDRFVYQNLFRGEHRDRAAVLRGVHGARARHGRASVILVGHRVAVAIGATVGQIPRVLRALIDRVFDAIAIRVGAAVRRGAYLGRACIRGVEEAVLILVGWRRRRAAVFLRIGIGHTGYGHARIDNVDDAIAILIDRGYERLVGRGADVLPAIQLAEVPILMGAADREHGIVPFLAKELDLFRIASTAERRQAVRPNARDATRRS